jgi:hypothetical protein
MYGGVKLMKQIQVHLERLKKKKRRRRAMVILMIDMMVHNHGVMAQRNATINIHRIN